TTIDVAPTGKTGDGALRYEPVTSLAMSEPPTIFTLSLSPPSTDAPSGTPPSVVDKSPAVSESSFPSAGVLSPEPELDFLPHPKHAKTTMAPTLRIRCIFRANLSINFPETPILSRRSYEVKPYEPQPVILNQFGTQMSIWMPIKNRLNIQS